MNLVDRELLRRLLDSPADDAALLLFEGVCSVVDAQPGRKGMLDARRRELVLPAVSAEQFDRLVHALDNTARDLGFS
ncbi:MAG: hypothetical protein ABIS86_15530 [Streptosporangiaceae bacterium]